MDIRVKNMAARSGLPGPEIGLGECLAPPAASASVRAPAVPGSCTGCTTPVQPLQKRYYKKTGTQEYRGYPSRGRGKSRARARTAVAPPPPASRPSDPPPPPAPTLAPPGQPMTAPDYALAHPRRPDPAPRPAGATWPTSESPPLLPGRPCRAREDEFVASAIDIVLVLGCRM